MHATRSATECPASCAHAGKRANATATQCAT